MNGIIFPKNPGHVVIGIHKNDAGVPQVYAYYTQQGERLVSEWEYNPATGHIHWLVSDIADTAEAAGAELVSYSSTVDFWEEAIS